MRKILPKPYQLSINISVLMMAIATLVATTNTAHANTNHDILPVQYQAGSYCPDNSNNQNHKYQSQLQQDLSCLIEQLKPYQQPNQPALTRYFAYKAQGLFNYANHENSEKSLTNAGTYSLNEGLSILKGLQTGQTNNLILTADIPKTSGLMRPDLWAIILAAKSHGGIETSPRELAYSEVKLIWAAAEYCEFGWRHAREHFGSAERWANQVKVALQNTNNANGLESTIGAYETKLKPLEVSGKQCKGQVLPLVVPTIIPQPIPIQPPPVVIPEPQPIPEPKLPASITQKPYVVHFALDKSYLSPQSQEVLQRLLRDVRELPNSPSLQFDLYGHTDRRASDSYNIALSKRRTQSVANYLMQNGIQPSHISQYPEGEHKLRELGNSVNEHALNRRVEIFVSKYGEILATPEQIEEEFNRNYYDDLQPEK